jgi:hypothetical protein
LSFVLKDGFRVENSRYLIDFQRFHIASGFAANVLALGVVGD